MKKILFISAVFLVFAACSSDHEKDETGKIKLTFQPVKNKPVKISYDFTVNQMSSGDVTTFKMNLSGKGETASNGTVTLELKNDDIRMNGTIQGNDVHGSASGPDSVTGDAKLLAMPVFGFIDKSYRSKYTGQLDKKTEMQIKDGAIVDSTENKMQFFVRYPENEVRVGDTWKKEIVIKAGNKMNCSAVYTLKEIKGDTAVVDMSGTLFGKGESFGNEFSMDGKLTGSFIIDIQTGWPLNSEIDQQFTLKMGGKDIPIKYAITSKTVE